MELCCAEGGKSRVDVLMFKRIYKDICTVDKNGIKHYIAQKNVRPVYKYNEKEINELTDSLSVSKVNMTGFYNELKDLKEALDNIIGTDDYFYFGYSVDEIGYHWDLNDPENKKAADNMREILHKIQEHMKIVYAYILAGLGERLEEK